MFKHRDDVIILCSHNTNRDFLIFKSRNINIPAYRVPKENLKWDTNAPFYFLLNKNLSVSNIHIPNTDTQQQQQISIQYLANMQNIINRN